MTCTPHEAAVARETLEIAFLAAVQHLPPRQREGLIPRDAAGFLRARDGKAARHERAGGEQRGEAAPQAPSGPATLAALVRADARLSFPARPV